SAGQRRLLALAPARLLAHPHAAAVLRQLGRAGPAPTRQLRGVRALGLRREMARGARYRALDALLHGLRRAAAEAVLLPLPQGRGRGLGAPAEGPAASAPPG